MANTLTNFLVGIGFEFDKSGAKEVQSSIDGVKSTALQAGAVIAGAFGINKLTAGFAQSTDTLGKFSETFGVIPNDVAALGRALTVEGGSLESFIQQLGGIERFRAGLLAGNAEFIGAAGRAGLDVGPLIAATDATEAYLELADQFAGLSQQQRLNAAQTLGLDESSIRLLSKGSDQIRELMMLQQQMRPVTRDMTESSAEFNRELLDLQTNIGGVADQISIALLPELNSALAGMNDWVDANRELISQNVAGVMGPIADRFNEVAVAGTLIGSGGLLAALAGMAQFIPIIGAGLATVAGAAASIVGVAGAAAGGYAAGSIIYDQLSEGVQQDIGRGVAQTLAFFGNEDAAAALNASGDGSFYTQPVTYGGAVEGTTLSPYATGALMRQAAPVTAAGAQRPIQVKLELDGQVIDNRIIDVTEQQNEQALRDIQTSGG